MGESPPTHPADSFSHNPFQGTEWFEWEASVRVSDLFNFELKYLDIFDPELMEAAPHIFEEYETSRTENTT